MDWDSPALRIPGPVAPEPLWQGQSRPLTAGGQPRQTWAQLVPLLLLWSVASEKGWRNAVLASEGSFHWKIS